MSGVKTETCDNIVHTICDFSKNVGCFSIIDGRDNKHFYSDGIVISMEDITQKSSQTMQKWEKPENRLGKKSQKKGRLQFCRSEYPHCNILRFCCPPLYLWFSFQLRVLSVVPLILVQLHGTMLCGIKTQHIPLDETILSTQHTSSLSRAALSREDSSCSFLG